MTSKLAHITLGVGVLVLSFSLVVVLIISTPEASRRNADVGIQDARIGEVSTALLPLPGSTSEVNPVIVSNNSSVGIGNPVATEDARQGIIYTPLPTDSPPPPTPLPTHNPVILACVATVKALPGYPTAEPTMSYIFGPTPHIYSWDEQRIYRAEVYMRSGQSGRVIATGKNAPDAPHVSIADITLKSYSVVEVTLPCPMTFGTPGSPGGQVLASRYWRIEIASDEPPIMGNGAYETCVDDVVVNSGIIFDPSVLKEGSVISHGYLGCYEHFSDKLHFAP